MKKRTGKMNGNGRKRKGERINTVRKKCQEKGLSACLLGHWFLMLHLAVGRNSACAYEREGKWSSRKARQEPTQSLQVSLTALEP
jgi:hypothetical protein